MEGGIGEKENIKVRYYTVYAYIKMLLDIYVYIDILCGDYLDLWWVSDVR